VPSPIRLLAVIEASTITGPAKNLLQFAHLARSRGDGPVVELAIAVFQRPNASTLFLDTARNLAIPIHAIRENRAFDLSVMDGLRSLVRDLQPEIVQSHAVKSHFLVRKAGIPKMARWAAFHHGYTAPELRARLYNQLDYWSLRAARQVITVSMPFREELIRKGVSPERAVVIHNAIDPDWGAQDRDPQRASALRGTLGIPPGAKVILLVGRFSREKDHLTLLSALADLRQSGRIPDPRLVLVGDGPERPQIEQAIHKLGLGGVVILTGQVPSAEPYYGIAHAAVLSSLSEGSPNALLEAMAVGIPIVATRVGGIPEIVRDGESALLVSPRDRIGMARALEQVLGDAALMRSLVDEARRVILSRHTPAARAERLIDVYRSMLVD